METYMRTCIYIHKRIRACESMEHMHTYVHTYMHIYTQVRVYGARALGNLGRTELFVTFISTALSPEAAAKLCERVCPLLLCMYTFVCVFMCVST